jgi:hypothetical protein
MARRIGSLLGVILPMGKCPSLDILGCRSQRQRLQRYWPRLAGGTMPFIRRYSTIWP